MCDAASRGSNRCARRGSDFSGANDLGHQERIGHYELYLGRCGKAVPVSRYVARVTVLSVERRAIDDKITMDSISASTVDAAGPMTKKLSSSSNIGQGYEI